MRYSHEELKKFRQEAEERQKKKAQEETQESKKYESAAGKKVFCLHCENDHFIISNTLLNTRGMTFLGLDWLNDAAITLTCCRCGFVHWFIKSLKKI